MPFRHPRIALTALCCLGVAAVAVQAAVQPPVRNSDLDASLFYEIVVGEMQLRQGDMGGAFQQLLGAARRTRDETLFRRAVEVALSARALEQALSAAKTWRTSVPRSRDAAEFVGRLQWVSRHGSESVVALKDWLAMSPASSLAESVAALPRLYAMGGDAVAARGHVDELTQPYVNHAQAAVRAAAWIARGQMASLAHDAPAVAKAAQEAVGADAGNPGGAMLALEQMPSAQADALVMRHLGVRPDSPVRLAYVRKLVDGQRLVEASGQLETLLKSQPQLAAGWLTLGALQADMRRPKEAEASLLRFLQLSGAPQDGTRPQGLPLPEADTDDEPDTAQGRTQAYLILAQIAEQRREFKAAEVWLAKVTDPQQALAVQSRRALVLGRKGQFAEARELIRKVPERRPQDARAKLMAEVQLLRDLKRWKDAYTVLDEGLKANPSDPDLLYEQAMVVDRLGRADDMERLLREVMRAKPDYHHAYNALGYSLADRNERLDEARTLVAQALALAPGDPFITDSLGWVEYRAGKRGDAIRLLREAWAARPDTEIGAHLGEVLWVDGQRDEARRIWRQARERDASNEVLMETLTRLQADL